MAERLESTTETVRRIDAAHPGWACYTAGGAWFARRTGPLTEHERRTRPQSPLEAVTPDDLEAAIRQADPPAPADELTAWST